ncbi:hypothetical protein TNCT_586501, partial [Trichonephila clavata]
HSPRTCGDIPPHHSKAVTRSNYPNWIMTKPADMATAETLYRTARSDHQFRMRPPE